MKLGDDFKIIVEGIGNVKLEIDGVLQMITGVFNLLSIGQLQERRLSVIFEDNTCNVYHPKKGLIIHSVMQKNKMFKTKAVVMPPSCFKTTSEELIQLYTQDTDIYISKVLNSLLKKEW